MRALAEPLTALHEALRWFVSVPEQRLLEIRTHETMRVAALHQVASAEHHGRNGSAFLFLEAPADASPESWELRAEELHEVYGELRAGLEEHIALPELSPLGPGNSGITRFGVELTRIARAITATDPFTGVVVVVAPIVIVDGDVFEQQLTTLMEQPALSGVRWIVTDPEHRGFKALPKKLGLAAASVDCAVDPETLAEEQRQSLAAMASAPTGATGPRALGAAGPAVPAPSRPGKGTAPSKEKVAALLIASDVNPSVADPDVGRAIAVAVLSAAQAAQDGKHEDALRHQQEAVRISRQAGLEQQAIGMELMLGAYVLQTKATDVAVRVYAEAGQRALARNHYDLMVQAKMGQAAALLLARRWFDASVAYTEAGSLGVKHGATVIAIEAYRIAGQLVAEHGEPERATTLWRRAIETAENAPKDGASRTSAPVAARQLAALCREHRLVVQAESLEAQANRLEEAATAQPTAGPV